MRATLGSDDEKSWREWFSTLLEPAPFLFWRQTLLLLLILILRDEEETTPGPVVLSEVVRSIDDPNKSRV